MSATALSRPATTRASSALLVSGLRGAFGDSCLIAALTLSALGLPVSSRAKTLEAVSGLSNLAMLVVAIIAALNIFRWR